MAARDHAFFLRTATGLARLGVTPNVISVIGMGLGVAGGVALAATAADLAEANRRLLFLLAAVLIPLRGVCNILDGVVAVNCAKLSPTGVLFNEVPDRISDAAMLIGAGYAFGGNPTLGLLAAGLAIFVAYLRSAIKTAGAPQDFCGPMAKPMRIGLMTTACVCAAVAPGLTEQAMVVVLLTICVGCVLTAIRRLHRAATRLNGSVSNER